MQDFIASLKAVSNDLDDIQRDILIQATFKVAAADGLIRVSPSPSCTVPPECYSSLQRIPRCCNVQMLSYVARRTRNVMERV